MKHDHPPRSLPRRPDFDALFESLKASGALMITIPAVTNDRGDEIIRSETVDACALVENDERLIRLRSDKWDRTMDIFPCCWNAASLDPDYVARYCDVLEDAMADPPRNELQVASKRNVNAGCLIFVAVLAALLEWSFQAFFMKACAYVVFPLLLIFLGPGIARTWKALILRLASGAVSGRSALGLAVNVGLNILPLAGIYRWNWNTAEVSLFYWLEHAVFALLNLLAAVLAGRDKFLAGSPIILLHAVMLSWSLRFIAGTDADGGSLRADWPMVGERLTALWPAALAFAARHGWGCWSLARAMEKAPLDIFFLFEGIYVFFCLVAGGAFFLTWGLHGSAPFILIVLMTTMGLYHWSATDRPKA